MTLRIDLEQRKWCRDACSETRPVIASTDALILLTNIRVGPSVESTTVSRESGRYSASSHDGKSYWLEVAQCQVAPFTGFPEQKF